MQQVRIGIIGIGNMGSAHAGCISRGEVEGLVLTAVCDVAAPRREWAATAFSDGEKPENAQPVAIFADYKDMLQSGLVDAVLIATPHKLHPVIAKDAFAAGVHVLSEKPAGVCVSQLGELYRIAEKSGKAFGIMLNQRTNELFAKARELVQGGALGVPKRLVWIVTNWYRTQSYYNSGGWRATWDGEGGGVLLNQAPHNLDIWQWIFGMPSRVYATCTVAKYHDIQVEDDATILAEYENGASAMFITTTGELPGTNRLEISGDKGKIVIENGKLTFWQLSYGERSYCFAPKGTKAPEVTVSEFVPQGPETAHRGILQNFTDHILKGEPLLAPGYDGAQSLQISNAAYLSSWTGGWVDLPMTAASCARFNALLEERKQMLVGKTADEDAKDDSQSGGDGNYRAKWNVNW